MEERKEKYSPLEMGLIYDNPEDGLFVINKPAGTDVFQAQYLATGYPRLWEVIQEYRPQGCHVNRIDRWTSGALACAYDKAGVNWFRGIWHTDRLRKIYLCVMASVRWEAIRIDYPIQGALAQTDFNVLSRAGGYALVSAELTRYGRTHQIRKHARVLGSPLVGDKRFRGPSPPLGAIRGGDGQLLHCWRMEFDTPSGRKDAVQAPVPSDIRLSFPDFDWEIVTAGDSPVLENFRVWPLSTAERVEAWNNLEKWGQTRGMEAFEP